MPFQRNRFSPDQTETVNASVTHIAARLKDMGGSQTVLREHLASNRFPHAAKNRFLVLFEPPDDNLQPQIIRLGLTWKQTIAETRARFRQAIGPAAEFVVYHDLWGLPFLADLDQAARRIGFVHCPSQAIIDAAHENLQLLDGLVSCSPVLIDRCRTLLPIENERLAFLPVPLHPPVEPADHPPLANRPLIIGYSGRIIRELKRIDRLPILLQKLEAAGVEARLEILGDGPDRNWLIRQFRKSDRVKLHGEKRNGDYWDIIRRWDFVLLVSDVEGMGISLLEGMSAGALPLYPQIKGGAEPYVRQVHPKLVYPAGDLDALAAILAEITRMPHASVDQLRATARAAVGRHLGDSYLNAFQSQAKAIIDLPRRSSSGKPYPDSWRCHVPFGLLRRVFPQLLSRRPGEPKCSRIN